MNLATFCKTTVGQKFIVAITGAFMLLFLIMHLAGNLEIFKGPDAVNTYAVFLRKFPIVLWGFRLGLIAAVVAHVYYTISLTGRNNAARPQAYKQQNFRKTTLASKTMLLSGLTVLAFVAYHLAHYTFGITNPEYMHLVDNQGRHHVYNMMVSGFSNPLVVSFYVLAQVLLAYHLSHGISSAARTLGLSERHYFASIHQAGRAFAVIIALAYISIPMAVSLGFLPLDM